VIIAKDARVSSCGLFTLMSKHVLKVLMETVQPLDRTPGRESNPAPPEYEAGVQTP
jgi:hypothetical protein